MMKYGIVQGRLLPQVGDFIQNFPDNWRKEFKLAKKLGVSHIEIIEGAPNNQSVGDYHDIPHDVPVSGVCMDWLPHVRHHHHQDWLVNELEMMMYSEAATDAGIKRLVLPLLESASLNDLVTLGEWKIIDAIIGDLNIFYEEFPSLVYSIETDLDVDDMSLFLANCHPNVRVTFDTGNLTKKGYDLRKHIERYGNRIDNIHIKDCKVGGTTVPLGTGDTDLSVVRDLMKLPNVEHVTFQTARNPGLTEESVFRYNVDTIERILNEIR